MSANRKGDRRERELVNRLDEAGFAVMRAPASGSATERELPDVLAGDGDRFYAIEAKSSAGDPIYLDWEEVEALKYFSENFGADHRIAVRFDREAWYFFRRSELHQTPAGNFRVKRGKAVEEGETIDDLRSAEEPRFDVADLLDAYDRGALTREETLDELRDLTD